MTCPYGCTTPPTVTLPAAQAPTAPTAQPVASTLAQPSSTSLAFTGADVTGTALVAALLIAGGGLFVRAGRRRA